MTTTTTTTTAAAVAVFAQVAELAELDAADVDAAAADTVARMVADIHVRDVIIRDAAADAAVLAHSGALLAAVASHVNAVSDGDRAAVLTLAGVLAWMAGDDDTAGARVRAARSWDPSYGLAALLALSLDAGMPVAEWRAMLLGMSREHVADPFGHTDR